MGTPGTQGPAVAATHPAAADPDGLSVFLCGCELPLDCETSTQNHDRLFNRMGHCGTDGRLLSVLDVGILGSAEQTHQNVNGIFRIHCGLSNH